MHGHGKPRRGDKIKRERYNRKHPNKGGKGGSPNKHLRKRNSKAHDRMGFHKPRREAPKNAAFAGR